MDFFDHQEQARQSSKRLIILYAIAVCLIVALPYLIVVSFRVLFTYDLTWTGFIQTMTNPEIVWHPRWLAYSAGGVLSIIGLTTGFKIAQLSRGGGGAVATSLGGELLGGTPSDPDERRLLNVVEEMAIASGIPVPDVYVLREESSINAFAAGTSPSNAAIGVTRGCLKGLNRDELQGVIAHEFSHILNGDMRLNIRLMGVLSGILALTLIGRVLLRGGSYSSRGHRHRRNRDGGNVVLAIVFGLALVIIGAVGAFFAKLIKAAVSRQREFLADAAAVQFTRNPDGISGALKKIAGLSEGARIHNPNAEETSHLFFGNSLKNSFSDAMLATHPPVLERIKRLDPAFDGEITRFIIEAPELPEPDRHDGDTVSALAGTESVDRSSTSNWALPPDEAAIEITPNAVTQSIGVPTEDHVHHAQQLLAAIPESLRQAAHEPFSACALIHSLVLSGNQECHNQQRQYLETEANPGVSEEVNAQYPTIRKLPREAHLSLVDLALPALRQLSDDQYRRFRGNLVHLIESDQEINLFEFTLQKVLVRNLDEHFDGPTREVTHYYVLKPITDDCQLLLSVMAQLGHDDQDDARKALQAGVAKLLGPSQTMPLLPLDECDLAKIDTALDKVRAATPFLKRKIVDALAHTAAHDNLIHHREADLLRAVVDSIGCPMPPILGKQS